jgi:hypothetical protein
MQKLSFSIILNQRNILRLILITFSLVVIVAFITATSYVQLAIAILFYPPIIYMALMLFPRKARDVQQEEPSVSIKPAVIPIKPTGSTITKSGAESNRDSIDIADVDKRAFLKMVGAAGLSFFLYSIFSRRIDNLIPGRTPEPASINIQELSKQIQTTETKFTENYRISELDEGETTYFGFTNNHGAWFIMKEDSDTGSFRYARGESDFSKNWDRRQNLKYDYFHAVFP